MNFLSAVLILCICSIFFGYFFGSLMWSIIIGKLFFKVDPRSHESKNAGATNSSRLFGKKVGLIILLLDISKGLIPTIVMWIVAKYGLEIEQFGEQAINKYFNMYTLAYLAGLFAIFGHCFPIFFKFKGGKGVATYGAFLLSICPFGALIQLILLVILVYICHYVSLSALISTLMSWIWLFVPGVNYSFVLNMKITDLYYINYSGSFIWLFFIFCMLFLATCMIWFQHRFNILALTNKTERKFYFK